MLSIITINLNNKKGLKKTLENIKSLKSNSKENIQLIVVDGLSTDGSEIVIEDFRNIIDDLVIESDKGIYDAMNKGIRKARNKWLNFMNSGDLFINFDKVEQILIDDKNSSVIYGDKIQQAKITKAASIDLLFKGVIHACHQSMFFRSSLGIMFSNQYKIYGDYDFVIQHYFKNKNFTYVPKVVSETEPNGLGQTAVWIKRKEKYHILFNKFGFKGVISALIHSFLKVIDENRRIK